MLERLTHFGVLGQTAGTPSDRETAAALLDAGSDDDLSLGNSIDSAFFANAAQGAMERQYSIRGELALRDIPLRPVPIVNVENACASASTALNMAYTHILSGQSEIALAVGAEKMFDADKAKMFGIFDGSWDVHGVEKSTATLLALGEGVETPAEYLDTGPHSVFMDVYQAFALRMALFIGVTGYAILAMAALERWRERRRAAPTRTPEALPCS